MPELSVRETTNLFMETESRVSEHLLSIAKKKNSNSINL